MNDTTIDLPLGDGTVSMRIRESEGQPITYLSLHDNENTSVEAALAVVRRRGGRIVELAHSGTRRLEFFLKGKAFSIDPNRIFSAAGIDRSLQPGKSAEAARHVATFAQELWRRFLESLPLVVALHNNTDDRYSILSYEIGRNAVALHVESSMDPDDFLLVTEAHTFAHFRTYPINLVQEDVLALEDGSLSVFCGRQGKPYVNVEAQHGSTTVAERLVGLVADYAVML